jgi:LCP family protein required for cell wall assembly
VTDLGVDEHVDVSLDEPEPSESAGGEPPTPGPPLATKPKGRPPWYLTAMIVVGCVLIVMSSGALILMYKLSDRYDARATHTDILGDVPRNPTVDFEEGPLNYLVLGTDSRADEALPSAAGGVRSDTILLVHITKGLGSAFIVSIPRDSYVEVPAGGSWRGGLNKINSAFAFGGAALAAKTIYNLSKIPFDGAMIINFAGVVNMVNAVGKVHVCVPYDVPNYFKDFPQYKNGWPKGCYDMGGEEAEVFMRQRHDVPGGDFGRIRSQQLVMKALIEKATSAGMLTSPNKLDSLLIAAAQSLTIDNSMNLRDLAFALKGIKPSKILFATAPYKGTMTTSVGSSVQLDTAGCQVLFKAILDDKTTEWLAAHPQPNVASYGPN